MYRFEEKQLSFTDFNQPQGLQMDQESRNDTLGYNRKGICKVISKQNWYACKTIAYGTWFAAHPETV